jgi:Spy/CpxP family protein refolding chaperone
MAAPVLIAAGAALAQPALAQPRGGPEGPARLEAPGLAMGDPHRVERMLDSVDATPDQRAQIRQILDAARADLKAQHEAGRKLHEQSQALFGQPTVDAAAAESLRQQMSAQRDQASKRMLQAMLAVSAVLTPEQRKAIAERAARHRAMMERHRAEREALDKSGH